MGDLLVGRAKPTDRILVDLDMNALVRGLLVSSGWNELVYGWQIGTDPRAP